MRTQIVALPDVFRDEALRTVMQFLSLHGEARIVGGAVRDVLLGIVPHEIDVASTIPPEQLMQLAHQEGIPAKPIGLEFGTVLLLMQGRGFEVTTLRQDIRTDGRHAEVEYTTDWYQDALRRDFTINALTMDLGGLVTDYVGGLEDLTHHVVRFVGNPAQRIREDYLRVLRFFRFSSRYARALDREGLEACIAHKEGLKQLSGERIQQEMKKLLLTPNPVSVLQEMLRGGILDMLLEQKCADAPLEDLEKLIELESHFLLAPDAVIRLAMLLLIVCPSVKIKNLSQRWALSQKDTEMLNRIMGIGDDFSIPDETYELHILIYREGYEALENNARIGAARAKDWKMYERVDALKSWPIPTCPVSGKDLLDAGMVQGRELGDRLKQIEARWLESRFTLTKEQLLSV